MSIYDFGHMSVAMVDDMWQYFIGVTTYTSSFFTIGLPLNVAVQSNTIQSSSRYKSPASESSIAALVVEEVRVGVIR